jgi:hypothetical protein
MTFFKFDLDTLRLRLQTMSDSDLLRFGISRKFLQDGPNYGRSVQRNAKRVAQAAQSHT